MSNDLKGKKGKRESVFSIRTRMLINFGLLLVVSLLVAELVHLYGVPFTGYGGEYQERKADVIRNLNLV